jgi:hypothetical protein
MVPYGTVPYRYLHGPTNEVVYHTNIDSYYKEYRFFLDREIVAYYLLFINTVHVPSRYGTCYELRITVYIIPLFPYGTMNGKITRKLRYCTEPNRINRTVPYRTR